MLSRYYRILFTCVPMLASTAFADFLPPNNLDRDDNRLRSSNVSEEDFNAVIDEVESVFGPMIEKSHDAKLKVQRLWDESTVNASAIQLGSTWVVNMFGGLARRPEVTRDGFTLVLCHELGHHLGGYPFGSSWAANEGQSDYFATQSCGRFLWKEQRRQNADARELIPAEPKAQCDAVWNDEGDQNLCYRLMLAGKSIADLAAAIKKSEVHWDTPDPKVVRRTFDGHSDGQCRLDTMVAGALCDKVFDNNIIPGKDLGWWHNSGNAERASAQYTCTQFMNYEVGFRPRCWFKSAL